MNYFQKANDYYNSKDYHKAMALYKKSMTINKNEAACLYNTAVCLIKLKNYKDAIPLLKKSLFLKMDSKYLFNLGYCYIMLDDNKKALINFKAAWALNPEDTDCKKAISLIESRHKITKDNL